MPKEITGAVKDRVIIKPIKEYTKSTIIVSDDKTDPIQEGIVLAVGPLVTDKNLKKGARILFRRPAGFKFTLSLDDPDGYIWTRSQYVLAVIKE